MSHSRGWWETFGVAFHPRYRQRDDSLDGGQPEWQAALALAGMVLRVVICCSPAEIANPKLGNVQVWLGMPINGIPPESPNPMAAVARRERSNLLAQSFGHAAKYSRISTSLSPLELFSRIQGRCEYSYLLESENSSNRLAEFSFIGFDPIAVFTAAGGSVEIRDRTGKVMKRRSRDPLLDLRRTLEGRGSVDTRFRFVGGAVGYVSYDAVRYWERLPDPRKDLGAFPDLEFAIFDDGLIFNHEEGETYYYTLSQDRLDTVLEMIGEDRPLPRLRATPPKRNLTRANYERIVRRTKKYIRAGDIFQAVLSKQFILTIDGSLLPFYSVLRKVNPSPYMYYLAFGEREVVGSSPEMLLRVEGRTIETFPIAGTRPRSNDVRKNRMLRKELLADPKEKAEHLMLVDLARNDVGKVAKYGTVKTTDFMSIMEFSHVQHIVSRVVGELQEGSDCFDAFRAIFPAGTVSGAPKPRAMEIIDELEPRRRGPYAGGVGYFSYNGNADFAIAIRTLFRSGREGYLQAGAGIVADSVPSKEWLETEAKAQVLLEAIRKDSLEKI